MNKRFSKVMCENKSLPSSVHIIKYSICSTVNESLVIANSVIRFGSMPAE